MRISFEPTDRIFWRLVPRNRTNRSTAALSALLLSAAAAPACARIIVYDVGLEGNEELSCQDLPRAMSQAMYVWSPNPWPRHHLFHVSMFRYDAQGSGDGAEGAKSSLQYVDVVAVEWWWPGKPPLDYRTVVTRTIGNRFASSSKDCYFDAGEKYGERDNLRTGERLSLVRQGWIVGIRFVRSGQAPTMRADDASAARTPPRRDRKAKGFQWSVAYPWLEGIDMEPTTFEESVFALDKIDCDPAGNFLMGSLGRIAKPLEEDAAVVHVARDSMLAANQYLGASGSTQRQAQVDASIDSHHYWCIPKREICYEKVDFGDFSIPSFKGQISAFQRSRVFSLRFGLAHVLQKAAKANCASKELDK